MEKEGAIQTAIRVPTGLYNRLVKVAENEDRSINSIVVDAINLLVTKREGQ